MKNLHNTIVENFMRFSPKNLDVNQLKKFLTEQDINYIERWKTEKEALDAFRKWESAVRNEGRVKLVKTNAYKDVTNEPTRIPVSFWNNFVTIDSMTNADSIKQLIDDALAKLTQQGVNLEDPAINISIISRATSPIASTMPNSKENTGKKRIDHDYNGLLKFDANGNVTPASKAEFNKKQQADQQWGNKILAQKRGEAASNYIKSKGIKANIKVTPEINAERREFVINAQVAGKEKYIAPITLPDMEIKIKLVAEWVVSGIWSMTGDKPVALLPNFYYSVNWTATNGMAGSIITMDDNNSGNNLNNSRWMQKNELFNLKWDRNPLQANKSSNYAGTFGDAQNDSRSNFLLGTGHFAGGERGGWSAASSVWEQLTNGASKTVSQLSGFNMKQWLTSTSNTVGVTGDVSVQTSSFSIHSFYGRLLTTAEEVQKAKSAVGSTKVLFEKTINLQDLATAAAAAGIANVSGEMSTDPKFWMGAAWYDSTVTPARYGTSLKENPNFFVGATFNKTPIGK